MGPTVRRVAQAGCLCYLKGSNHLRRACMSPWLSESQKAIESVLAVFTLGISSTSTRTSTSGKEEFVSQQTLTKCHSAQN